MSKERLYEEMMAMPEDDLSALVSDGAASSETRRMADRARVEGAMRKAIRSWFICPPELRSTPTQLGERITEIAAEWNGAVILKSRG